MQQVRFNDKWSKLITEYGVPQGSALGPCYLLFILMILKFVQKDVV